MRLGPLHIGGGGGSAEAPTAPPPEAQRPAEGGAFTPTVEQTVASQVLPFSTAGKAEEGLQAVASSTPTETASAIRDRITDVDLGAAQGRVDSLNQLRNDLPAVDNQLPPFQASQLPEQPDAAPVNLADITRDVDARRAQQSAEAAPSSVSAARTEATTPINTSGIPEAATSDVASGTVEGAPAAQIATPPETQARPTAALEPEGAPATTTEPLPAAAVASATTTEQAPAASPPGTPEELAALNNQTKEGLETTIKQISDEVGRQWEGSQNKSLTPAERKKHTENYEAALQKQRQVTELYAKKFQAAEAGGNTAQAVAQAQAELSADMEELAAIMDSSVPELQTQLVRTGSLITSLNVRLRAETPGSPQWTATWRELNRKIGNRDAITNQLGIKEPEARSKQEEAEAKVVDEEYKKTVRASSTVDALGQRVAGTEATIGQKIDRLVELKNKTDITSEERTELIGLQREVTELRADIAADQAAMEAKIQQARGEADVAKAETGEISVKDFNALTPEQQGQYLNNYLRITGMRSNFYEYSKSDSLSRFQSELVPNLLNNEHMTGDAGIETMALYANAVADYLTKRGNRGFDMKTYNLIASKYPQIREAVMQRLEQTAEAKALEKQYPGRFKEALRKSRRNPGWMSLLLLMMAGAVVGQIKESVFKS